MKRLFKVLVVLSLTVMLLMNMASCKNVLDKAPYLDGPTDSTEVTSDLGNQTTPEETPIVTNEPITNPTTEPEATEPEVTEPAATEPEVTEPAATEPAVTEPAATEPAATEPAATEPAATEPAVTEPAVTEPEVTEPAVTEPAVTEPAVTEPAVTEPAVTEPAVTEPAVTEPAVTEPEVDPDLPKPVENKVTVSIADYATANNWKNDTKFPTIIADKNITITAATPNNGAYTGKYFSNNKEWRIYQTDGGSITITAADGKTIVSVKITYNIGNYGFLVKDGVKVESNEVVSVNGNSVIFGVSNNNTDTTKTNGQVKITAIEIIYLGEAEAPSCQHTGAEAVRENEVGATCSTEGSYESVVYCSKCGVELSRETKTIDKLDHTPATAVKENEVPASCSKEGSYDLVVYCSVCKTEEISRETKTIGKLDHTPADAIVENEVGATCIATGSYDLVVKCSACGYEISRETKTTEKIAHSLSDWNIVKDSTCKEKGTKTRECTVCDYKETVDIPTKSHNYDDNDICVDCGFVNDGHQHTYESVVTPPTCTAEGYTTHTCACGESYKDNTVPATHTPAEAVEENKVGATCSKEGSYDLVIYCSKCGHEISREPKTIGKLAHTMGAWEVTTAPTCTTKGVETSKCENCDYFETKDVDTIAHTPAEAVEENRVGATCSKEGSYDLVVYCSVCKAEEISRETKTIDKLEHTGYETDYKCDVCSTTVPPQADSALTIAQAITLGKLYSSETPTTGKYYLSGIVTEIYNTTYGNMYITDGTNTIIVYGVYDETGNTRYDAMTVKPAVGDKITVYGVLGQYDKKAQLISGWMTELCKHSYTETKRVNATCTAPGSVTELCSECGHSKTTVLPTIDHNYENGQCTECEKIETIVTDATISFADKNNRVEYTTNQQIWVQNGITVTNNKDKATANIGDYSDPARFYKGSTVIIAYPGMTKLVINCTSADYAKVWESIEGVTAIRSNTTVTITFNAPTDSFTASMSAKSFVSSITVYSEVEKCLHKETVVENAADATCTTDGYTGDTVCSKCGETVTKGTTIPATDHTPAEAVKENEVPATCAKEGSYDLVVKCAECGEEISRTPKTIDKLDHTPAEAVRENEVPASCSKEGSYDSVVYCSACTEQISRETKTIDKLAHTMGAWEVTTAPTCTTKGVETSKCENCDYFETRDKDTLDHTPGAEATCTTPQTCTGCDYVFVNALNHTPGAAATCTTAQTCTKCGETLVAALNHADENNDNICDRENCKASLCGENNHIEDDGTVTKDATCTEKGEKTYKCTACGNTLRTEEIPATGHTYIDHEAQAPTCTNKGWEAYQTCEKCQYTSYVEIPETGHATTKAYTVIDGVLYYAAICGCEDQREAVEEGTTVGVANEADLKTVLTAGYSVVLTANIELTSAIEIEGKQVIINLGGYTITADWVDEDGVVEVLWAKGTGTVVTINGEGSMKSGTGSGTNSVVSSTDGAIVNINGGYYYSASYGAVIATTRNGVVNIYGGKFEAAEQFEGKWYVLDIDERVDPEYFGEINVYGGEFVNYDPVNNTNDGAALANKVADGYHSIKNDDSYVVSKHTPGDEVIENVNDATCSAEGSYESVIYCSACHAELSRETKTLEKADHTPAEAVKENEIPATCTTAGSYDSVVYCSACTTEMSRETITVDALEHNYSYGKCSCGKQIEFKVTTATMTFDANKTGREEFSTSKQVWVQNGIILTNNKGSGNNIADYSNPIRFYKGSTVTIAYPDMTKIVITATSGYVDGWKDTVDGATITVSGTTVTIIFAKPTDSITLTMGAQARAATITVTSEELCNHIGDAEADCDTPQRCTICGATLVAAKGHKYENETVTTAATCTTDGLKTLTCICGDTKTEIIPATGHSYDNETVTTAATCTTDGLKTLTCACGDAKTEVIPATGHIYIDGKCECGAENETGATTVIFNVPDGIDSVVMGEGNVLPSADAPDGYTFAGWSEVELDETTTEPTILKAGDVYNGVATVLYAVYTRTETTPGTQQFVKVTSAPSDWSGQYLIVYETGKVAFNGALTTLDAVSNTVNVTINNGTIQATDTLIKSMFTISKSGSDYTIKSASGYYIGNTADSNKLNSSTSTKYTNTISLNNDGSVQIVGSGGSILRYNANSGNYRFRYFKSGTYTSQKAIHLYKLVTSAGTTTTYYDTL